MPQAQLAVEYALAMRPATSTHFCFSPQREGAEHKRTSCHNESFWRNQPTKPSVRLRYNMRPHSRSNLKKNSVVAAFYLRPFDCVEKLLLRPGSKHDETKADEEDKDIDKRDQSETKTNQIQMESPRSGSSISSRCYPPFHFRPSRMAGINVYSLASGH